MSFKAEDKTVKSIFQDILSNRVNNNKQPPETYLRKFIIPDFQRKYAWGIEQFDEFWTDLTSVHHQTFFGTFLASR